MIRAHDLIALWRRALDEGWGYIWGCSGQVWTAQCQAASTREATVRYGSRWIGRRVADCSGLAAWAFRELGGAVYHGSNTIFREYVACRCELRRGARADGSPLLPGDPVFKKRTENEDVNRHHIGYYVGDDTVIEAKGTVSGVVTSRLEEWHETAHWKNVEYEGGVVFMDEPILKKGAKGPDVAALQTLLNENGCTLPPTRTSPDGVDGVFGAATEGALIRFQQQSGLQPDGVCGPDTWAALKARDDGAEGLPALRACLCRALALCDRMAEASHG